MIFAQESHVDGIGGAFFSIEPPFAFAGAADFVGDAENNVHHATVGFPAGDHT